MPIVIDPTQKIRDADRSRQAILDAAEELFAEDGLKGTSLNDIAVAAGLSRGAPNYFFGSKTDLYAATLERVFRDREEATQVAFEPLSTWAAGETKTPLETALREAIEGYMNFLERRPSFIRLIQREELDGAANLQRTPRESKAMEDAFSHIRQIAGTRGVAKFDVSEVVVLFISLTFSPLSQRNTFMASVGIDLDNPKARAKHVDLVASQLMHAIT